MFQLGIVVTHCLVANGEKTKQIVDALVITSQDGIVWNIVAALRNPFLHPQRRKLYIRDPEVV